MLILRRIFLGIIFLLLFVMPALAGLGSWESHGPEGGKVHDLAIAPSNPDIMYAGLDYGGVFKSTDGGLTWAAMSNGVSPIVRAIAVSPTDPAVAYAGTWAGPVFKTTDGGLNWTNLIGPSTAIDIAIDQSDETVLYAGTYSAGVYISTDSGTSWVQSNIGFDSLRIYDIEIAAGFSNLIYAGTGMGIYKSTDSAGSWALANSGMPASTVIYSLAIDPSDPATLYAGTANKGLYKSTDSGANWSALLGISSSANVDSLYIDPNNTSIVFAGTSNGLYRSTDAGVTWTKEHGPNTFYDIEADPSDTSRLFAAHQYYGVHSSVDGGVTWAYSGTGIAAAEIVAVAADPQNIGTVYAATYNLWGAYIHKSTDGGTTWAPAGSGASANTLAVHPSFSNAVYAGSYAKMYLSPDSGSTWTQIANTMTGLPSSSINAIKFGDGFGVVYAGISSNGVYKSVDGGVNWTALNTGIESESVWALEIDPTNQDIMYAGTTYGVFNTTNGGMNWALVNSGMPSTPPYIHSIVIDPSDPATLYATVHAKGIYKSTDRGANWILMNTGLTSTFVNDMVVCGQELYAITESSGVYNSVVGASTWTAMNNEFPGYEAYYTWSRNKYLAATGVDSCVIYAGTYGLGVWTYNYDPPPDNGTDNPDGTGTGGGGGGCFIATAAYGSYMAPDVMVLRQLRDEQMLTNPVGRWLVNKYYAYSPPMADYIATRPALRAVTRIALAPVVGTVKHPGAALVLVGFAFGGGVIAARRKRREA